MNTSSSARTTLKGIFNRFVKLTEHFFTIDAGSPIVFEVRFLKYHHDFTAEEGKVLF